jgi:hypothetical protein
MTYGYHTVVALQPHSCAMLPGPSGSLARRSCTGLWVNKVTFLVATAISCLFLSLYAAAFRRPWEPSAPNLVASDNLGTLANHDPWGAASGAAGAGKVTGTEPA